MPKRYQDMTAEELARATREYDRPWEGRGLPGKPLTAAERRKFERLQQRMRSESAVLLRPPTDQGVKVITLGVEPRLLRRADALAKRRGTTRSAIFAQGLKKLLAEPRRRSA